MKILIIGAAPARNGATNLEGISGERLVELSGLERDEWLDRFDRVNLLEEWPGRDGKGDAFHMEQGKARALEILSRAEIGTPMVLLGRNVLRSFRFAMLPTDEYFVWQYYGGRFLAPHPHPSGLCHWWNDPMHVDWARKFWQNIVTGGR